MNMITLFNPNMKKAMFFCFKWTENKVKTDKTFKIDQQQTDLYFSEYQNAWGSNTINNKMITK